MTNKLIAECCDRVGEVYASPDPVKSAGLTNEQAAVIFAHLLIEVESVGATGTDMEALRMAEAALRAQGWRPIATAPKDGREIIGQSIGGAVTSAVWIRSEGWIDADGDGVHLTLWMPLPAPHPQGEEHAQSK